MWLINDYKFGAIFTPIPKKMDPQKGLDGEPDFVHVFFVLYGSETKY